MYLLSCLVRFVLPSSVIITFPSTDCIKILDNIKALRVRISSTTPVLWCKSKDFGWFCRNKTTASTCLLKFYCFNTSAGLRLLGLLFGLPQKALFAWRPILQQNTSYKPFHILKCIFFYCFNLAVDI